MTELVTEEALEPALPIIDPHHHLRDRPDHRYLLHDFAADLSSGHNVLATVAIESGDMYCASGPAELRSVGEVEFLGGIAAMFASGRYGNTLGCAGIVGFADLRLGASVQPVLEALAASSGGRLRGIRNPVAWHASPELRKTRTGPEGILRDRGFRAGVALLGANALSLDVWLYHPQLPELVELARACPDTTIVLDHLGGPLGAGPFRHQRAAVFGDWRAKLTDVACCPNIVCKLGGVGMPIFGFGFDERGTTSSVELASAWRPYIETAVELFGVDRCMFESNFPPDKVSFSYVAMWNAFKRIVGGASAREKSALFSGTAARVYRLQAVAPPSPAQ